MNQKYARVSFTALSPYIPFKNEYMYKMYSAKANVALTTAKHSALRLLALQLQLRMIKNTSQFFIKSKQL